MAWDNMTYVESPRYETRFLGANEGLTCLRARMQKAVCAVGSWQCCLIRAMMEFERDPES